MIHSVQVLTESWRSEENDGSEGDNSVRTMQICRSCWSLGIRRMLLEFATRGECDHPAGEKVDGLGKLRASMKG